jgi:D-alanyl-D-alanine carboxypeptidase-like protein
MLQKVLQLILSVLQKLGIRKQVPLIPAPPNSSSPTPLNPSQVPDDDDLDQLEKLYPPFADLVRQLLQEAAKQGMQVGIFEGMRSFERQRELYAQGRNVSGHVVDPAKVVTDAPPGLSAHNYGLAVDLVFNGARPGEPWQWNWGPQFPWKGLAELGKGLGLDAAYFWTKFPEEPHFELIYGENYHELLALYTNGGLQGVWDALDKRKA